MSNQDLTMNTPSGDFAGLYIDRPYGAGYLFVNGIGEAMFRAAAIKRGMPIGTTDIVLWNPATSDMILVLL
jgi:hypothetical protein